MKRREFLERSGTGLASAAMTTSLASSRGGAVGRRPNIVVIVADDAGWNDVGYHGSEIETPVIDRLAREGLELDRFYVYPVCSPTRAAFLTGRPPSRFGIIGPIAMRSTLALPKDVATLAECLGMNGYDTVISGKWHLGLRPEVGPGEYGFDRTYGYLHGQIDQFTHRYKNGDRSWHRGGEFVDEDGHATDLITGEAVRFIREYRDPDTPFFLYVPYSVPHYPLQEEEQWTERYRGRIDNESRRLFAASMTHMDDGIGRIVAAIEDEGIAGDTLFIFMSDNGGQESWTPTFEYDGKFTANDRLGDNSPLRGWKGELYEGGIRVPALMYRPGHFTPTRITAPVSVCDLYPTLAAAAGSPIPDGTVIEGIDVTPALTGGAIAEERTFYWRTAGQLAVRRGDWKLVHGGGTPDGGGDELFNIADDPLEERDIADSHPDIVASLSAELGRQYALDA